MLGLVKYNVHPIKPSTNGNVPHGVAAFGMAADGTRIIIHGGMQEYGK